MSLKVLVIPEDPTYNGAILQPLAERMLAEIGKQQARVKVLTDPKLGGIEQARRAIRTELPDRYRHVPLWLFFPDADEAGEMSQLEGEMRQMGIALFGCAAQPEVEAWLLAGHRQRLGVPWSEVRQHSRLKEEVFAPFINAYGNPRLPDQGRAKLMQETLGQYRGLLSCCPELQDLEQRLRRHLGAA
ncbi:MAG: hypothetical protein J0L84_10380 [Verrucomicrobia bacterium]|nr:hypothetical protein [Verrucomicrobiota bacterium]